MTYREVTPKDIEVFSEAIAEYFEVTSGQRALVRSAYLLKDGDAPVLWSDFHGVIAISDGFIGTICFSAPRKLLSHILMSLGDRNYTDESHLDLVGEIANTLSGRARRHFGDALTISTPMTFQGRAGQIRATAASKPFAIPFTWRGYEAGLVVNLDPGQAGLHSHRG